MCSKLTARCSFEGRRRAICAFGALCEDLEKAAGALGAKGSQIQRHLSLLTLSLASSWPQRISCLLQVLTKGDKHDHLDRLAKLQHALNFEHTTHVRCARVLRATLAAHC